MVFCIVSVFDERMAPIKALLAILPALSNEFSIKIFVLRQVDAQTRKGLPDNIELIDLSCFRILKSIKIINAKINEVLSEEKSVVTFSMGLFADIINCKCINNIPKVVSLRGSLHNTYRIDYGLLGSFLWRLHYRCIKHANKVLVMTRTMASDYVRLTSLKPEIIGNFIDEAKLQPLQKRKLTKEKVRPVFLFLGRFVRLKQPQELLNSFKELRDSGYRFKLIMYGDGPLRETLQGFIKEHELEDDIEIRGHSREPWLHLNENITALILPSLSEGVSRAAMEALYLGIPVLARDVDSNHELVDDGKTGKLFTSDRNLYEILVKVVDGRLAFSDRGNLLPDEFRQEFCEQKIVSLFKGVLT